jgi:flagellar assembly factor FliW
MEVKTTRFGTLNVEEDKLIHFPLGLLGFEHLQRFLIIDADSAAPMRWLQAADEPAVAFLVVEPQLFFADYTVTLEEADRKVLALEQDPQPIIAGVVVVPENPSDMTINLLAPLVMNAEKRLGKQVVMHTSGYSPHERLLGDRTEQPEPAIA